MCAADADADRRQCRGLKVAESYLRVAYCDGTGHPLRSALWIKVAFAHLWLVGSGGGCTTRGRGVLCLVLGLVRMCVVMRWRVWWLVSRPRRWGGFWGTGVGR